MFSEDIRTILERHMPLMNGLMCKHWMNKNTLPKYILVALKDSPYHPAIATTNANSQPWDRFKQASDGSFLIPCTVLPPHLSPTVVAQAHDCESRGETAVVVAGKTAVAVAGMRCQLSDELCGKSLGEAIDMTIRMHMEDKSMRTEVVIVFHPDAGKEPGPGGQPDEIENREVTAVPLLKSELDLAMLSGIFGVEKEHVQEKLSQAPAGTIPVILVFEDCCKIIAHPFPVLSALN